MIPLLLVGATTATFVRVSDYDFVNYDDLTLLVDNPHLNPPTFRSLLRFWREPYEHVYNPVTYTVWAGLVLCARIPTTGGTHHALSPRVFHIANIVLHVLNVLMVFTLLRLLIGGSRCVGATDWAAGAGALLFGLHPVQVEPVVWVTGMKEVLCGFFSFLALWQYLTYATKAQEGAATGRRYFHYAIATLCFLLALLSKPAATAVPFIAWVLDRWMLKRQSRQSVPPLLVWMIMAAALMVAMRVEQPYRDMGFIPAVWTRPFIAGDAVAFYLLKVAVPMNLGPDYGRTPQLVLQHGWAYLTWLVPCALGILLWWFRDRSPWLLASGGVFVAGMLPVSGLVPFNFQNVSTVADRYLYLSMLGPALALAGCLCTRRGMLVGVIWALGFTLLGFISALQASFWRNTFTLFERALEINPHSWKAYHILGTEFIQRGDIAEGIACYTEALRIKPSSANIHNDLAFALLAQGKLADAIAHWSTAIRIAPRYPEAHNNLAVALARQGKVKQAMAHWSTAIRLKSDFAEAHNNLGSALCSLGKMNEGIAHYRKALQMNPRYVAAHYNLAKAFEKVGRVDEAITHYTEALRLKPDFTEAQRDLTRALQARRHATGGTSR
ncbi:MAG: tetratricopeptide repeat protein [Abditibacteriales bacterium]|nr:tetratricopeptide repeat protein [Abditibacteriales bacterium]